MSVGRADGARHPQQGAGLSSGQQEGTVLLGFNGVTQAAEPGAFDNLPAATIPHILTHLPIRDLTKYKCVSKEWKQLGKREEQNRIEKVVIPIAKAINEDTRSIEDMIVITQPTEEQPVEDMMVQLTEEQRKCLEALKDLPPNDIGQAIKTLRPEIISKQTKNTDINDILQNAASTNKIDDNVLLALIFVADIDQVDSDGTSALYRAAYAGHTEIVKVLLGAGADVNKADSFGVPPLFGATFSGDIKIVKALLEAGADVSQVSFHKTSALYWAACDGHTEIVKALLEAGADVNQTSFQGTSALYWAAYDGHAETVQALLDAGVGADVNQVSFGETPLSAADRNGHMQIVDMLEKAAQDGES